jgi:hypothetical protein
VFDPLPTLAKRAIEEAPRENPESTFSTISKLSSHIP